MTKITCIILILIGGISNAQTLQMYIEEAEAHNPELQAMKLRYTISREKIVEANTLPNTEVSAGFFISEPETRTGAQKARFSIKQMVPWFGTITARENYASALAEVDYLDMIIAQRKLRLSLSQSYYKLYAIERTNQILEKNVALLQTYEKLALTAVEVGNASVVDVLRLQIRRNELEQRKKVLEQDRMAESSLFNHLLNRNEPTEIIMIDSLAILSDSFLGKSGLELHPELEKYDKLFESVTQSELLNLKDAKPNIGFGLDYITVAERDGMVISDNGKDILMPMVSLSIPLFNTKNRSLTEQNELKLDEMEARKASRRNELQTILDAAVHKRQAAKISYETQAQNLKQAKHAEDILLKGYETGSIDFNALLEIQELQLKFQLSQVDAVKNYFMQIATINYLTN
ncbi:TolC family protein [Pareuzebyella sediminis]|uniref:TolC family protein n=1 Tax=Pareuzebyella sediminis TaxID=2607998 RepID=UPI0011EDF3A3|nr:TolC family protein [Pareuzebyella sediminis]